MNRLKGLREMTLTFNRGGKRSESGKADRDAAYVEVRKAGGTHQDGVRAYVDGNQWATENAKNTGNLR